MPTVGVNRDELFAAIGQTFTDEEFDHLCFEFGIELDDITSEKQLKQREQGKEKGDEETLSDAILYKIDVPANRYDLLCVEGIARALRVFMQKEKPPTFQILGEPNTVLTVKPSTQTIRPFVVAAILRNVQFNEERYASFLDLQEKLHQNICRRRTLVAIGTHDLDTIQGPFTYDARAPDLINFVPLTQSKSFQAKELLDFYRTSPECKHLKPYTDIIYDSPVYPVIEDKNDIVLSMPPIINGEHSKITLQTTNIFIECTATDITKANIVLNTMITMFSQYASPQYSVEPVTIQYEESPVPEGALVNGKVFELKQVTPDLSHRFVEVKIQDIYSMIFGKREPVNLDEDRMCQLLTKMQLAAVVSPKDSALIVADIPPTRSDILHAVDVIEDVAIAYGFNNIPQTIPTTQSIGMPQPLNKLGDSLRDELSRAGYIEILTHGLCATHENFDYLRRVDTGETAVVLKNPATIEFEVVRTTLLPGVLKTIQNNKGMSMKDGLKLFEISDVVVLDSLSDVGAKNVRKICAAYTGYTDGFEIIHGVVDRIMQLLGIPALLPASAGLSSKSALTDSASYSYVVELAKDTSSGEDTSTFFPGRCAEVFLVPTDGKKLKLGVFGVLHPEVLKNFELLYPASMLEMDLEPLV